MIQSLNGALDILKALARPYSAFNGALVMYFAPYKMYRHDVLLAQFERVHPRYEYVNEKTGERTTQEPDAYRLVMEAAQKTGMPPAYTEWRRESLWTQSEIAFVTFESHVVHIDFTLTDSSPTFLKALQAYWKQRNGSAAHDWLLFQYLVSVGDLYVPLWNGYTETRDPVTVPIELAKDAPPDADPEAEGRGTSGEPTPETSTSAS